MVSGPVCSWPKTIHFCVFLQLNPPGEDYWRSPFDHPKFVRANMSAYNHTVRDLTANTEYAFRISAIYQSLERFLWPINEDVKFKTAGMISQSDLISMNVI